MNEISHPRYFTDTNSTFCKELAKCIFERQDGLCGYCGTDEFDVEGKNEYHHVLRWEDGGATNLENGVMLCKNCHTFVHNAGNFRTEIMLPRVEFEFAHWEKNPKYAERLKQRVGIEEINDSKTIFSNQKLLEIDKYWQEEIKKAEKPVNKIQKTSSLKYSTGGSMSENNLEYQLELLGELKAYTQSFLGNLHDFRAEYIRKVNELRDAGMITNHHEYFRENVFDPRASQLLKLIQVLEERDLVIVDKEIHYIQNEIERLKNVF